MTRSYPPAVGPVPLLVSGVLTTLTCPPVAPGVTATTRARSPVIAAITDSWARCHNDAVAPIGQACALSGVSSQIAWRCGVTVTPKRSRGGLSSERQVWWMVSMSSQSRRGPDWVSWPSGVMWACDPSGALMVRL